MNVLMTADTVGGVWSYALELCGALSPFGVRVTLATMGAPLREDQRADVRRLDNVTVHESAYKLEWMQDCWNDVEEAGRWLMGLAAHAQPDLVHLNNFVHGALPWSAPVLMVGHSCVLSWFRAVRGCEAGPEWDRYREEVTAGLRAADVVVAPTRAMLDALREHYGPFAASGVIGNGLEPDAFTCGRKENVVLAAGRLWDAAKNISALASVAGRLKWPVHVAGEDCHPDGGRAELPNLCLLGRLCASEMRRQFAHAAIYALPARYEPFGLTVLEAALSGCALVLGEIPSQRELWDDRALFVAPGDEERLVEVTNRLIDTPGLRERLARSAQQHARRLTSRRMAEAYYDEYQRLHQLVPPLRRGGRGGCAERLHRATEQGQVKACDQYELTTCGSPPLTPPSDVGEPSQEVRV